MEKTCWPGEKSLKPWGISPRGGIEMKRLAIFTAKVVAAQVDITQGRAEVVLWRPRSPQCRCLALFALLSKRGSGSRGPDGCARSRILASALS